MGYNDLIEQKTLLEKEKLLVTSNFFFSHNVFKSCLLLMRQNDYLWSKGLRRHHENNILTKSSYVDFHVEVKMTVLYSEAFGSKNSCYFQNKT